MLARQKHLLHLVASSCSLEISGTIMQWLLPNKFPLVYLFGYIPSIYTVNTLCNQGTPPGPHVKDQGNIKPHHKCLYRHEPFVGDFNSSAVGSSKETKNHQCHSVHVEVVCLPKMLAVLPKGPKHTALKELVNQEQYSISSVVWSSHLPLLSPNLDLISSTYVRNWLSLTLLYRGCVSSNPSSFLLLYRVFRLIPNILAMSFHLNCKSWRYRSWSSSKWIQFGLPRIPVHAANMGHTQVLASEYFQPVFCPKVNTRQCIH